MKTCFKLLAGVGALAVMSAPASAATYLFSFNFDALDNYAATSIVYSADSIGATSLSYFSGSVNGFSTGTIVKGQLGGPSYAPTNYFGDGFQPAGTVIGFFFRTDQDPTSVGIWETTETAGRSISGGDGSAFFRYTTGRLVISEMAGVPEPASWAMMMLGFGALGLAMRARRQSIAFA